MNKLPNELAPNEVVLWQGCPRAGLLLRPIDFLMIPITMLWAAIAFAIFYAAVTGRTTRCIGCLPISAIMSLVALHLLFGRFILDKFHRGNLSYAVTSHRILIQSFDDPATSIPLDALPTVSLVRYNKRYGSLVFDKIFVNLFELMGGGALRPFSTRYEPRQFEMISQPEHVRAVILSAMEKANGEARRPEADGEAPT